MKVVGPSESPCRRRLSNCQGTPALLAAQTTRRSPMALANSPALPYAFRLSTSIRSVFHDGWKRFRLTERNRLVRTRMSGWGDRGERATAPPMPIFAVKRFVRKAIQF